jgi:uncharacterized protein YbjT (DUF2867 family)
LKRRGYHVRGLTRALAQVNDTKADETIQADLTRAESLSGVCAEMDAVISCAGASLNINAFGNRQTFYQVDWQGNANLLAEARQRQVQKFVYVSLAGGQALRHSEYADAHERFVEALQTSGLPYTIIRPTGFFGFLLEILKFAQKGRGLIIGNGRARTNPIHEAEVARACVEAVMGTEKELPIGGPEVFTRREITELAFEVAQRPPRLLTVSPGVFKTLVVPLKLINPRMHALMDFGIAVTQVDCIAPAYGQHRLRDYFAAAPKL